MNETVESAVDGEDPVVGEFLRFLARDMQSHPVNHSPKRREIVSGNSDGSFSQAARVRV